MTNDILLRIKNGDRSAEDELLRAFEPKLKDFTAGFFFKGADRQDILQVARLALLNAARAFENDKGGFENFARVCIRKRLYDEIRKSSRKKHLPLNDYISLSFENEEDEPLALQNASGNAGKNPLDILIDDEQTNLFEQEMQQKLSELEFQILKKKALGQSYADIANELKIPLKSVDNAMQRIRKKILE